MYWGINQILVFSIALQKQGSKHFYWKWIKLKHKIGHLMILSSEYIAIKLSNIWFVKKNIYK